MTKTAEDILADQLATCLAAMQDSIAAASNPVGEDKWGHLRSNEMGRVATLLKASAKLTLALARLKGETSHNIHVTRTREAVVDKG